MGDFASWFNQEANSRGLSYADIARAGRISKSMISRVVSGQSQPGLDFLVAVCRAFAISADVVLGRAGLLPAVPEATAETEEAAAHRDASPVMNWCL